MSELASSASGCFRNFGSRNSTSTIVPLLITQQLLEMSLTLASTQIIAWLNSPAATDLSGDMDIDDFGKPKIGISSKPDYSTRLQDGTYLSLFSPYEKGADRRTRR
jgi:hypothetical protein